MYKNRIFLLYHNIQEYKRGEISSDSKIYLSILNPCSLRNVDGRCVNKDSELCVSKRIKTHR